MFLHYYVLQTTDIFALYIIISLLPMIQVGCITCGAVIAQSVLVDNSSLWMLFIRYSYEYRDKFKAICWVPHQNIRSIRFISNKVEYIQCKYLWSGLGYKSFENLMSCFCWEFIQSWLNSQWMKLCERKPTCVFFAFHWRFVM